MSVIAVHVVLLLVDLPDDLDAVEPLLFELYVLSNELIDISEVSANVLKLRFDRFTNLFACPLLALRQREILFFGVDTVHPRLFEVV